MSNLIRRVTDSVLWRTIAHVSTAGFVVGLFAALVSTYAGWGAHPGALVVYGLASFVFGILAIDLALPTAKSWVTPSSEFQVEVLDLGKPGEGRLSTLFKTVSTDGSVSGVDILLRGRVTNIGSAAGAAQDWEGVLYLGGSEVRVTERPIDQPYPIDIRATGRSGTLDPTDALSYRSTHLEPGQTVDGYFIGTVDHFEGLMPPELEFVLHCRNSQGTRFRSDVLSQRPRNQDGTVRAWGPTLPILDLPDMIVPTDDSSDAD